MEKSNAKTLKRDVANIRLMGAAGVARYGREAEIAGVESSAYRTAGRTAVLKPAATLLGGYSDAKRLGVIG